jgi:DNA-directed RNA polymerase subunit RPC12/RpoP
MTRFVIDHQCPQCGAPASLEETDRLYACPFCRVKSFLLARDYFRYVLPARSPAGRHLVYLPYWRFKGLMLFSLPAANDHKFVDVSHCAAEIPGAPASLGLRAQALKLRFAAPDMEGAFVPPARSFAETFGVLQKRFSQGLPRPVLYHAHLGESMGLLYSPFYAGDRLYDAVLDTPVARVPAEFAKVAGACGKSDWKVGFVAALCPECGWDLEGERDALVLHCRNCRSSWYPSDDRLTRVESHCLEASGGDPLQLPFWQVACDVSEVDLKTCADMARLANLPRVADSALEEREFRFWTPAFKVRAQVYLRLAESLTLNQAQDTLAPGLPNGRHHPVTLPVEEACESLKVVLAGLMKPRRRVAELLPAIRIHPTRFRLAYLPFQEDRHDYVQPHIQLAVNRNLLSLSRNL